MGESGCIIISFFLGRGGLRSLFSTFGKFIETGENGYDFAVMIYSFGTKNTREDGTLENKVNAFVDAGGKRNVNCSSAK